MTDGKTQSPSKGKVLWHLLTCDIAEAVATGLAAAGGKNLEVHGADIARQCVTRGLIAAEGPTRSARSAWAG